MDIWTSLQLDHMTTPPVALPLNFYPGKTASYFAPLPCYIACRMVRVGGKQAKLTLTRWCEFGALPTLPDGAERSLTGTCKQHATGLQIQGCASPPPPFCFRFGGLLTWDTVLAA